MKKEKVIKRIFSISIIFLIILICFSNSCIVLGATTAEKMIEKYTKNPNIIKTLNKKEVEEWIERLEDYDRSLGVSPSAAAMQAKKQQVQTIIAKLYERRIELNEEQKQETGGNSGTSGGGDTGIVQESPAFSHGSWINPDDFNPGELSNADDIINKGNIIIGALKFVGMVASILALITLGIKYMVGSVEEKAEYKQTMWPYIVGTVLLFGTTTVLSIIEALAKEF